jgi:hypothetical protein
MVRQRSEAQQCKRIASRLQRHRTHRFSALLAVMATCGVLTGGVTTGVGGVGGRAVLPPLRRRRKAPTVAYAWLM